jgi:hypothetical protein
LKNSPSSTNTKPEREFIVELFTGKALWPDMLADQKA